MDLEEIRGRKSRMEEDIQETVSKLVDDFILKTGVRIEGISIQLINATSLEDSRPRYLIGQVEIKLERI